MKTTFILLSSLILPLAMFGCASPFERGDPATSATGENGGGEQDGVENGTGDDGDTGGGAGGKEYGYADDVYPILTRLCSGCHGPSGFGSYKLSGTASADYDLIKALVSPDAPSSSKLLTKGTTMVSGFASTSEDYKTVEGWITQGAANN